MKSSTLISWLLLISGTLTYVIGLEMACPLLSGKGYFLGVLVLAMFVTWIYLREMMFGQLDDRFIAVCRIVAIMTLGLLCVGVINAPLTPVEKGLYPAALFVGLWGLARVVRASDK